MRRFLEPSLPQRGAFALAGDEGLHLVRVLRARPGDLVLVFDGRGREARCRVTATTRDAATLEVVEDAEPRRPRRDVLLVTAVPRGERMEWLVEKCVEAGVSAVVPWAAARSVRDRAGASTLRRWRRAAAEACKQCGRADLPEVSDVLPLADALARAAGAGEGAARVLLVADPAAEATVEAARGDADRVAVVIGPEGGFAPDELDSVLAAGARPFGLGPLVLRVETAAVVAVHRACG